MDEPAAETTSTAMIRFVEARLREARAIAEAAAADWEPDAHAGEDPSARHVRAYRPQRALAEIAAKEEIVRLYRWYYECQHGSASAPDPRIAAWLEGARMAVLEIAKIDKEHPDFDGLWQIYYLGLE